MNAISVTTTKVCLAFVLFHLLISSRSSSSFSAENSHVLSKNHRINLPTGRPLVIAHRGASGTVPEHTTLAYRRAIEEGADLIECDVTLSRDLIPVCLHDIWLETTTDVADRQEFLQHRRNRTIVDWQGQQTVHDGWFAIDFTLDELKRLRKHQKSRPYRDQSLNGQLKITTLDEHITVAKTAERPIGIYPELKNPEWINSLDVVINSSHHRRFEDIVIDLLHQRGYIDSEDPCLIQSFSHESIRYVSTRTNLSLVLLLNDGDDIRFTEWIEILYGIGVWVNALARHWTDENGYKNWIGDNVTDFVATAHSHHLMVHVWTLRNEDSFLAWDFNQDVHKAIDFYLRQSVDGIFTDFPQTVVQHLDYVMSQHQCSGQSSSQITAPPLRLIKQLQIMLAVCWCLAFTYLEHN